MIFILRASKETDNAMKTVGRSVKRGKDHDDQESWAGLERVRAGPEVSDTRDWGGRPPAAACVVIRTLFIIKQMSDAFHIEYALWCLLHAAKKRGNDSAKVCKLGVVKYLLLNVS